MYSLTVRDSFMIAHSFRGETFGPAQRLHGATYVVEVTFRRPFLDDDGLVIDIGLASRLLDGVLEPLRYTNLDELPEFSGVNTTTEFMAREIFDRLARRLEDAGPSAPATSGLHSLCVVLRESPDAWASYDAPLR